MIRIIYNPAIMQLFYSVYFPQSKLMRDRDIEGHSRNQPFIVISF